MGTLLIGGCLLRITFERSGSDVTAVCTSPDALLIGLLFFKTAWLTYTRLLFLVRVLPLNKI